MSPLLELFSGLWVPLLANSALPPLQTFEFVFLRTLCSPLSPPLIAYLHHFPLDFPGNLYYFFLVPRGPAQETLQKTADCLRNLH